MKRERINGKTVLIFLCVFLILLISIFSFASNIIAQGSSNDNQLLIIQNPNYVSGVANSIADGQPHTKPIGDDPDIYVVIPTTKRGFLGFLTSNSYSWSLSDPSFGTLEPLYGGYAVKILPNTKQEEFDQDGNPISKAILTVTDGNGLSGSIIVHSYCYVDKTGAGCA